jgi:TRAP-type C4-dicarboxylate transport system permease small subunit
MTRKNTMRFVGVLLHLFIRLASALLGTGLLIMVVVMCALVITRYIFGFSLIWSEETTRYLMVWMTMLGGAILVLYEDHLSFTMLASKLEGRAAILRRMLVLVITIGASLGVAWTAWSFALGMQGVRTPASGISMTIPTLAVPVGFTLCAIFALISLVNLLLRLMGHHNRLSVPNQTLFMDGSFATKDEALPEMLSAGDRV